MPAGTKADFKQLHHRKYKIWDIRRIAAEEVFVYMFRPGMCDTNKSNMLHAG